jgi:hypothetical protein
MNDISIPQDCLILLDDASTDRQDMASRAVRQLWALVRGHVVKAMVVSP